MHELSIANSIVDIATDYLRQHAAQRVQSVTLRLGALSCVHKSALEFCFELVSDGTPLAGARLRFVDVPVAIFCEPCQREVELPDIQRFRCPICGTPSADVRRGQELDVETIEIAQPETVEAST